MRPTQTVDDWLQLSNSSRSAVRAVSVLAVSSEGPVARASMCLEQQEQSAQSPASQDASQDEQDYYDEEASDEDDDDDSGELGRIHDFDTEAGGSR